MTLLNPFPTRYRHPSLTFALALLLVTSAPDNPRAADPHPPVERIIPQQALAVIRLGQGPALLDLLLSEPIRERVAQSQPYLNITRGEGGKRLSNFVRAMERRYACDWQTLARRILGGGATVAVGPGGATVVVVEAQDPTILDEINSFIVTARATQDPGATQSPPARAGIAIHTFNGGATCHAIAGNRLIASNSIDALHACIDLQTGAAGNSIADLPAFNASPANRAPADDTVASVALAPALVARSPLARQVPPDKINPLVALVLGGYQATLQNSDWVTLTIALRDQRLTLDASVAPAGQATAGHPRPYASAPADDGAWPNLDVPRRVAALSLFRDLGAFYAAKDDLFPERTSGLIFFENMMGIFFSGRDLAAEIMGAVDPHIRLVVAEQLYTQETGTPSTKIPAFALVFHMRDPNRFAILAEEAWQKALGLANFTRGQQAKPGFLLDRKTRGDVRYTTAAFSQIDEPDRSKLDSRFNFRPSIARAGEFLILSSTDQLAEDLIDSLRPQQSTPPANPDASLALDGPKIAAVLRANRASITRGSMAKKGIDQPRADREFNTLTTILDTLGTVEIDVTQRDATLRARAQINLRLPPLAAAKP